MEQSTSQKSKYLLSDTHARFLDASWYGERKDIVVGGAGGIGSWLSLFLGRTGHVLHVYDMDTVENHNLGGQFFSSKDLGKNKAEAIVSILTHYADNLLCSHYGRWDKNDSIVTSIMFACFDNMESRKDMFDEWVIARAEESDENRKKFIFIDGRLEAETMIVYAVKTDAEIEKWREEWFPDSKLEGAPCTYKATSHSAAILAGLMQSTLNNFLSAEDEQRSVPFRTAVYLPSMMMESKEL